MEHFFGAVGALGISLLLLSLSAATLALMGEAVGKLIDRWRFDVIARRDAELGQLLLSGVHWLSEYPQAQAMTKCIGERMCSGLSIFPGHWRDDFLRELKAGRVKP